MHGVCDSNIEWEREEEINDVSILFCIYRIHDSINGGRIHVQNFPLPLPLPHTHGDYLVEEDDDFPYLPRLTNLFDFIFRTRQKLEIQTTSCSISLNLLII